MSNNPFLRNNKNNNRFNLLNDDADVPVYTPVNDKTFNENRSRRDNNNRYTNKIDDNRFKTITSEQPKLDINNIKAFPTLFNSKECDTIIHTSTNFKDILNNVIEEDTIEHKDIILPGWLKITMLNGKVLKEEYKKGEGEEAAEETDEAENQKEINYNMYKIGNALQTNYEIYEKEYDLINGEGSYDKNFRLSPVYGSEYDSNSESENNDENNNDDEYEN